MRGGDEGVEIRKGRGSQEGSVEEDAIVAAEIGEAPDRRDKGGAVQFACISNKAEILKGKGCT